MAKRNKASLNMAPPFKITKITVLTGSGTDQIRLETSLPLGVWPYKDYPQTLRMEVSRGMGEEYVRENFGIEPEVIQV